MPPFPTALFLAGVVSTVRNVGSQRGWDCYFDDSRGRVVNDLYSSEMPENDLDIRLDGSGSEGSEKIPIQLPNKVDLTGPDPVVLYTPLFF